MSQNTIPPLRIVQEWGQELSNGMITPTSYALEYQDKDGNWKHVPVIHRWPEPQQSELPLENRSRS